MRTAAALLLMCDPRDLGVSLTDKSGTQTPGFEPDLHLYDNYPGGIGQSQPLYQMNAKLLAASRDLIAACPCESGCPSCVGPEGETGSRGKEIALRILEALLA
jgi:DEAD/DEAH box helicase domain-containing protein